MNVFEDLIEELKEENLLEETVIDIQRKNDGHKNLTPKIEKPEVSQNYKSRDFRLKYRIVNHHRF